MLRARFVALPLLLLAATAANAQDRLFLGHVTATWDNIFLGLVAPPAKFQGGGPVTPLGITSQTGVLTLQAPVAENVYPGSGSVSITAANGNKVTFNYQGLLFATSGIGIGTFQFTGGTGKYTGATGGGVFFARIDMSVPSAQPMTVELLGKINY